MIWLDEITQKIGQEMRLRHRNDRELERMSDFQIMRLLTAEAAQQCIEAANRGTRAADEIEHLGSIALFFLRPGEARISPYACTLGRDLAAAFSGATASRDVKRHAETFARDKFVTYIDVADRAFRLGQRHHLKGLVIMRIPRPGRYVGARAADPWIPNQTDRLRIFATLGAIGELAQVRLDWTAGAQPVCYDEGLLAITRELPNQSAISDIAVEIENLVWLTLAYAAVANRRDRTPVPAAPDEARERRDRAARRRWRQFTLFKVERLRPPADNFGRQRARGEHEWHLGRRIAVQSYFKMQPYGPESQLRKLIFVKPHCRGPIDGAPMHKMISLNARV